MKNDFCALCAELLREFSSLYSDMSAQVDFNDAYLERTDALITRARAALTQQRANSRKAIDAIAAIGQEDENYGEDYGETQRLSNAVQSCLSQREEILSAFIAKYGFHPEMAVQIEQRQADGTSTWRIEKRPSPQTDEKGPTDDEWYTLVDRVWDKYETIGYQGERIMHCSDFGNALDIVRKEFTRYGRGKNNV